MSALFPAKVFFTLDIIEQLKVIYWNSNKLNYLFKEMFKNTLNSSQNKNFNFLFADGYVYLQSNEKMKKHHLKRRIKDQFFKHNKVTNFSKSNLFYLDEIISFCKKNEINLYLLTTPLHKEYINEVPDKFKRKYGEIINDNKLNIINLQNLQLNDSCYAHDGDHVTNKGANNVTLELINSFKNF